MSDTCTNIGRSAVQPQVAAFRQSVDRCLIGHVHGPAGVAEYRRLVDEVGMVPDRAYAIVMAAAAAGPASGAAAGPAAGSGGGG